MEIASLLRTSGVWLQKDEDALNSWARRFLNWMLTSELGKAEHEEGVRTGTGGVDALEGSTGLSVPPWHAKHIFFSPHGAWVSATVTVRANKET